MESLLLPWASTFRTKSFAAVYNIGLGFHFTMTATPAQNATVLLTYMEIIRWVVAAMVIGSSDTMPSGM